MPVEPAQAPQPRALPKLILPARAPVPGVGSSNSPSGEKWKNQSLEDAGRTYCDRRSHLLCNHRDGDDHDDDYSTVAKMGARQDV